MSQQNSTERTLPRRRNQHFEDYGEKSYRDRKKAMLELPVKVYFSGKFMSGAENRFASGYKLPLP